MQNKESKSNTLLGIGLIAIILLVAYFLTKPNNTVIYETAEGPRPTKGNPEAKLVLKEYSDFACPACGKAAPFTKTLLERFGNDIKFEYNHFPLTTIHSNAFSASVASECANDQGKFWEYHDKLFAVNDNKTFTTDNLRKYAEEIEGLDIVNWQTCIDSEKREETVKNDAKEARVLNLNSTPTFLLNDSPVTDWTKLEQILEMELGYLDKK
jgi:protein-disulfide isomerase